MNEVYMDVPAVRNIAKKMMAVSDTLTLVDRTLEVILSLVKTTAFSGLVGGTVLAYHLSERKPYIRQMADKYADLSADLEATVDAFERGDQQGSTRFY